MRSVGYIIGRYPWAVIAVTSALLAPILSYFVFYPITIETDVRRGFAHQDGRSFQELEAFGQYYNLSMQDMELMLLLVESKDPSRSRLPLTVDVLNEVERLEKYANSLSVPMASGRRIKFADVRAPHDMNFLFHTFKWGLEMQEDNFKSNRSLDASIRMGFPSASIYDNEFSVLAHFIHPTLYSDSAPHPTTIESVETIVLWYVLQPQTPELARHLRELSLLLYDASKADTFSEKVSFQVYTDKIMGYEMACGTLRTLNLFCLGVLVMVIFTWFALRDLGTKQQLILIPSALLSPFLAMATAFGLIGWSGIQFNSVMVVTPFLVLGVGVDDAFLMLNSWRRHRALYKDPAEQMDAVVRDIGPSVSITSITNMLAFSVGILSPFPSMSRFCICTAIGVFMDFILQFGMFGSCMALAARISSPPPKPTYTKPNATSGWMKYSVFVVSKWGKATCVIILAVLYVAAYFGMQKIQTTFEPQKTFPSDARLQRTIAAIERVYVQYHPLSFVVNKPPVISDEKELSDFLRMVGELESLPSSYGANQTQLWLRQYVRTQQGNLNVNRSSQRSLSYQGMPEFLSDHMLEDKGLVRYHKENGTVVVDSFVFVLVTHGTRDWHDRAEYLETVRHLIDSYPQFNITVFDYDATIFDLINSVKPEMVKGVILALTCMTCVCFCIIPNAVDTGIAITSVLSTSYTLLGILGFWGQELDPVTLVNVLMAIGFSVDFSSHICYHYHELGKKAADGSIVEDTWILTRLSTVLSSMGRPMIEATISTVICALPLFFVPVYMVVSFAKTIVCVCALGIFHGLMVVPVLLSLRMTFCTVERNRIAADRIPAALKDASEATPMIT
ncbi:CRE-PTR-13 protein [Aphelenchoides avenae]|nr:CRE-PTR-13 protein [Aphelenchus avenae]